MQENSTVTAATAMRKSGSVDAGLYCGRGYAAGTHLQERKNPNLTHETYGSSARELCIPPHSEKSHIPRGHRHNPLNMEIIRSLIKPKHTRMHSRHPRNHQEHPQNFVARTDWTPATS